MMNTRHPRLKLMLTIAGAFAWLAFPPTAQAHVKWFSDFSYTQKPNNAEELFVPTFFWLAALSMAVIGTMVCLEDWISHKAWVKKLDAFLRSGQDRASGILRLGMGATLLWAWQASTLLAPELEITSEPLLWLEFVCGFLLVFKRTVPWAGVLLLVLYGIGVKMFGFFYMLDYLMYVGIAGFFIATSLPWAAAIRAGLPLVYATVGFCLIWLGIEKLVYPAWAKMLLEAHPALALGFEHNFFVMGAAFVEISLGFMIMAGLQQRLLALTITCTFFLTTLVFGRQEVVGHTLIHAVLIVFLIAGSGGALPPLEWLKSLRLRVSAAALGFAVFLGALLVPYVYGANLHYETTLLAGEVANGPHHSHEKMLEISGEGEPPELAIALSRDPLSGWNLELVTENFEFAPKEASLGHNPGHGHAHLYIDGRKIARLYGRWYHITDLTPGAHEIRVTLNANTHAAVTVHGKPVAAMTKLEVVGP